MKCPNSPTNSHFDTIHCIDIPTMEQKILCKKTPKAQCFACTCEPCSLSHWRPIKPEEPGTPRNRCVSCSWFPVLLHSASLPPHPSLLFHSVPMAHRRNTDSYNDKCYFLLSELYAFLVTKTSPWLKVNTEMPQRTHHNDEWIRTLTTQFIW